MEILGLLSVIGLVLALIAVQVIWGPDYGKTFSRLVARKKSSILFYFVTFALFLSSFSFYIVADFVPKLGLPGYFIVVFFIGVIAQFVCVTVPEIGGVKTKIHLLAASLMSVSVLAQVCIVLLVGALPVLLSVVCFISLIVMLFIWAAVILRFRVSRYELALQSLYFVAYLVAIIAIGLYV